jgi:two-component system cell cycle response regulator
VPPDNVSILLVEDNPGDARLFREILRDAYASRFELVHCTSLNLALDHLSRARPDVVVVDLGLPDASGIEAVKRTRANAPGTPVVVLTSRDDESVGLQALHEGAQDYLIKGDLDARLLSRALRYSIERHRMQSALQSESLVDELTKLYNRRGFLALAENHLALAERTREPFALVFIDLDGMKQINDSFGHQMGDRALMEAATLLGSCVRHSDVLARLGGDEFVMLLNASGEHSESVIRERLQAQFDAWNSQPGRQFRLSFSVGVVTAVAAQGRSLEELLAEADALMYRQKQQKRGLA